jgi:hypothetical protein
MTISQFALNLFLNVVGSLIGVVVGVWYSRYELSKLRESEKKELRVRLIEAFKSNINGVQQMIGQLTSQPPCIPDYRLDTESIAHILFHGRDLFEDENWFRQFNHQRYQLGHINAKVDFLNDITNLSGITPDSIFVAGGVAQQRYLTVIGHLQTTHREISGLIADYEKGPTGQS